MANRRVGITGLGVVSPLGCSLEEFWKNLLAGKAAFAPIQSFDPSDYRTQVGSEVKGPVPREAAAYALEAATKAFADAKLDPNNVDPSRAGIALGSTSGEALQLEKEVVLHLEGKPYDQAIADGKKFHPGSIPARLASSFGFRGPNIMLTTACAAGNSALSRAFHLIRSGRADLMVAGGVDVFVKITFAGFNRLLAVAPEHPAPFSPGRRGLIPGEGCGILILEDLEKAEAQGRRVYAEMTGFGMSSDAKHATMPDIEGVARAMAACLEASGLTPETVDYISAHGTGTPANDKTETAAIKKVFGSRAPSIPISSIKSMLGHCMGAASALEAVACCLALQSGEIPPTINHKAGDPDCDLDYVPNKSRKIPLKNVISNAFAFGGGNAVIALGDPKQSGGRRTPPSKTPARVVITGVGTVDSKEPVTLAESLLPEKNLSTIDRPIAFAICGVKKALDDARLSLEDAVGGGIVLDSSGEIESQFLFYRDILKDGPGAAEPGQFPITLANAAASRSAIIFGLSSVNISLGGSFSAGESALALARDRLISQGQGIILAGAIHEAASVFVLETLDEAKKRGARIYAEFLDARESFVPGEVFRPEHGSVFSLAEAIKGMKKDLTVESEGWWGGRISLRFGSV